MSGRIVLYGVSVDALSMNETVERCMDLIAEQRFVQQTSINAGKVVLMHDDGELLQIVAGSDLVSADGQSIVWASKFLGRPLPERVAGIDLMEKLLERCARDAVPVFFLGARPDVLSRFLEVVTRRFPELLIAGHCDGYRTDDSVTAEAIATSGARVLFVAMPSPRKEFFLSAQSERLEGVFAMGVGGSFDVWAGVTRRAPGWMQRMGLEWLFRFGQEPRRMWRRYVIGNARFIALTMRERLNLSHADRI